MYIRNPDPPPHTVSTSPLTTAPLPRGAVTDWGTMTEVGRRIPRRLLSRRAFAAAATTAAFAPIVSSAQAAAAPTEKTAGKPDGGVRRITLYAENMPDGQLGY